MPHDLFNAFPKASKNIWTEIARKELSGKDPFESLAVTKENLSIRPYYDVTDTGSLQEEALWPSSDPYLGPRTWHNTPLVKVVNSVDANKIALDHLNNGADGILFAIRGPIEVHQLLANIELPYCGIYFLFESDHSKLLADFELYARAKKFDTAQITGGVFWESLPGDQSKLTTLFRNWDKFRVLGIMSSNEPTVTSQITNALLQGEQIIASALDKGSDLNVTVAHIAFYFNIGGDFFLEVAKLKAFRRLWRQVIGAYGLECNENRTLIYGVSNPWNNKAYEPNANMLKGTTAAISAILGGCNAITILPDEEGDAPGFKDRVARNVLTILREESHLNQTADPTAGSYYLETLVDQISKVAWAQFQLEAQS